MIPSFLSRGVFLVLMHDVILIYTSALVINSPSVTQVAPGANFNLTCSSEGGFSEVPTSVLWTRNGLRLKNGSTYIMTANVLVIDGASPDNEGVYQCTDTTRRVTSNLVHILLKTPPVLSIENATLTEGSPGDLICRNLRPLDQITGYQWMKNGEPIEGETFADLFFPSSTRNDSGTYSCTATNNNGNSSVTAYLTVQYLDILTPSPTYVSFIGNASNSSLSCQVEGYPTPSVTWTTPPTVEQSMITILSKGSLFFLNINVKADTSIIGHYACNASNAAGTASAVFDVSVIDFPSKPTQLYVNEVTSRAARITWTQDHNGNSPILQNYIIVREESSSQNMTITDTVIVQGNTTTAIVTNLTPNTGYQVFVIAENKAGNSSRSLLVSFNTKGLPPNSPPSNMTLSMITSYEAVLQWNVPQFSADVSPLTGSVLQYVTSTGVVREHSSLSLTSARATDLCPGVQYNISGALVNSEGRGPWSTITVVTNSTVPTAPFVFARPISSNSIEVTWSFEQTKCFSLAPLNLTVQVRKSINSPWSSVKAGVLDTHNFLVSDLDPSTTYQIRLFLINEFGRSRAGFSAFVQTLPADPINTSELDTTTTTETATTVATGAIATSSVNVQATVTGVVVGLITIVGAVMILLFVGVVCYKIRKSNVHTYHIDEEHCSHATIPEAMLIAVGREYEKELNNIAGNPPQSQPVHHHHVHFGESGNPTVLKSVVEVANSSKSPSRYAAQEEEEKRSICDKEVFAVKISPPILKYDQTRNGKYEGRNQGNLPSQNELYVSEVQDEVLSCHTEETIMTNYTDFSCKRADGDVMQSQSTDKLEFTSTLEPLEGGRRLMDEEMIPRFKSCDDLINLRRSFARKSVESLV